MRHSVSFLVLVSLIIGIGLVLTVRSLLDASPSAWAAPADRPYSVDPFQSPPPLPSEYRYVSASGNDTGDCTDSEQPCRTLQYAADQANPNDWILVTGGIFTGTGDAVVSVNKSLTFLGGYSPDFSTCDPQANPTIVDGENSRRGFTIIGSGSEQIYIAGFHIRNGKVSSSNGEGGGGLFVQNVTLVLSDVQVYENAADSDTTFGYGGGLYAKDCNLVILSSSFTTNTVSARYHSDGGGLYAYGCRVSIRFSSFSANRASWNGGGLSLVYNSASEIISSTFRSNRAAFGGGIYVAGNNVVLTGNDISDNKATSSGGGIRLSVSDHSLISTNFISGNKAATGGGIFLEVQDAGNVTISGNYVLNNEATEGGSGIRFLAQGHSISLDLANNVVAGNRAQSGTPGIRINLYGRSSAVLRHNTLVSNTGGDGSAISAFTWANDSTVTITNTIIASHTVGVTGSGQIFLEATLWDNVDTYIAGDIASAGAISITGQARFADDLYHIAADSDAVDQGVDAGVFVDIDGEARPFDAGFDIGADEFRPRILIFLPNREGAALPGQTVTYTHILTNISGGQDTFTLTLGGLPAGWTGSVTPPSVSLEAGASAPVTVTVQVPADALSGTVATAIVTATSSANPSVYVAVINRTTVLQRAGVALAPNREGAALPGQTITYTHILTNTGNGRDTFTLILGGLSAGWTGSVAPTSISLEANASAPVTVTVQVPADALSGTVATAIVTATSSVSPSVHVAVINRTTVLQRAGVALAPNREGAALPSQTVTYTHILTNTGNGRDTFTLTLGGLSAGWTGSVTPTSISLEANASAPVTVTVQAPADALSGTVATAVVTATSSVSPSVHVAVINRTTVLQRAGVALAPNRAGAALPSQTVTYTHTLTNAGNGLDTFTLILGLPAEWIGSVIPTSISLAAGASAPVTVTVQVPADALSGTVATAVVMATSSASPSVYATVTNRTTVLQRAGVALAPNREGVSLPGKTVTYTHILTNAGNGRDTFTLSLGGLPLGWSGSVVPTSISLEANSSAPVTVTIQVPTGVLSGTVATAVVTATSSANPSVYVSVTNRITVQGTQQYIYLPLVLRNYRP